MDKAKTWKVWVGGDEVSHHYLYEEKAKDLAIDYIQDGYDDVQIENTSNDKNYELKDNKWVYVFTANGHYERGLMNTNKKLGGVYQKLRYASGWFLTEEIPTEWDTQLTSEEEMNKWIEDHLTQDYEYWSADYVWEQIESLASFIENYKGGKV